MGMLRSSTDLWLWQIENNGAWRWDVGDLAAVYIWEHADPKRTITTGDFDWRLAMCTKPLQRPCIVETAIKIAR